MTATLTRPQSTRKPRSSRKIRNPRWLARRDRYMAQTAKLSDAQCEAAKDWINSTFFGA